MRHGSTFAPAVFALGFFFANWNAAGLAAEPLDDRLGLRTAPIMLLLRSDVQTDPYMKLDAEQVASCHRAARVLYQRAVAIRGKTSPAVAEERRAINEQQTQVLRRVLTAEQSGRLKQIDLQWEGVSAMLSRPLLDDSLNLTPEQKEAVSKLVADASTRRSQRPPTYEEHTEVIRAAIGLLTERQKHLWTHVLGPPCQFRVDSQAMAPVNTRSPAAGAPASGIGR
jgi:hypothetical protein